MLEDYKNFLIARGMSINYHNSMRVFLAYLGDKKLTQEIITQFFLQGNYSIQSKNSFIKAGRSYYLFLGQVDNEWKKIKLLKAERKEVDYITEKELGQAIAYLITYKGHIVSSIKAETLLSFLYYSGIRKGELLFLKRKDFDLENCSVKIWGEKTKEERITYYSSKVKEMIVKYFESEPEQSNAFNISLYDINYVRDMLKKCFPQKKITIHLFRHSACRFMQRKGIPLAVVKDIMGHHSIATTMLYSGENEEGRRNIYKEKMK